MIKTVLEYLKVIDEVDLEVGIPLDLLQGDLVWKCSIEDMAIDAAGAQLFDRDHLDLQCRVYPVDELASVGEVGAFQHSR